MPLNFNAIVFLILLLAWGCTRASIYQEKFNEKIVLKSSDQKVLLQLKKELSTAKIDYPVDFSAEWAKKLLVKDYQTFVDFLLGEVVLIDYSPDNCRNDQMACSFPDKKFEIYLNDNFFKVSKVERISTLLHELLHHLTNYKHFICFDKESQQQLSCDESLYSAYGVELFFMTELSKHESIESDAINAAFNRLRKRVQY